MTNEQKIQALEFIMGGKLPATSSPFKKWKYLGRGGDNQNRLFKEPTKALAVKSIYPNTFCIEKMIGVSENFIYLKEVDIIEREGFYLGEPFHTSISPKPMCLHGYCLFNEWTEKIENRHNFGSVSANAEGLIALWISKEESKRNQELKEFEQGLAELEEGLKKFKEKLKKYENN